MNYFKGTQKTSLDLGGRTLVVGRKYQLGLGTFPGGDSYELAKIYHPEDELDAWGHALSFCRGLEEEVIGWEAESGNLFVVDSQGVVTGQSLVIKDDPGNVQVFESQGDLAPEGAKFNRWTADDLRGNVTVRVYDRETRRCQLNGIVTEAYQYGGLTILAIWDADEPLAWAMVLNPDGSVTHYDKQYDILAVEEER